MIKKAIIVTGLLLSAFCMIGSETLLIGSSLDEGTILFNQTQQFFDEVAAVIRSDLEIKLVTLPFQRSTAYVTSGKIDGDCRTRYVFMNNKNVVKVDVATLQIEFNCFVYKDLSITDKESLKNYRILLQKGNAATYNFLKDTNYDISYVFSTDQAFQMVLNDRADVYITSMIDGVKLLYDKKYSNSGLKMLQPPIFKEPLYLFLHNKHAGLVDDFEVVLIEMFKSGRINEIFELP